MIHRFDNLLLFKNIWIGCNIEFPMLQPIGVCSLKNIPIKLFFIPLLPPRIAPLYLDQPLGLCSPNQWGGSNCQRFGAYLFRFVSSFCKQWNCIFSPLDVAVFLFLILFRTSSIIFYVSEFFRFKLKNSNPSSGVEPGSSRFIVWFSSTALAGPCPKSCIT